MLYFKNNVICLYSYVVPLPPGNIRFNLSAAREPHGPSGINVSIIWDLPQSMQRIPDYYDILIAPHNATIRVYYENAVILLPNNENPSQSFQIYITAVNCVGNATSRFNIYLGNYYGVCRLLYLWIVIIICH